MKRLLATVCILLFAASVAAESGWPAANRSSPPATASEGKTQIVFLGTGTPVADPDRFGPSVAIVVNGAAYIVDCGPGVVRRAAAAARNGIDALRVANLKTVFITHLHSDHTLGYPDLILSPAVLHRNAPLEAYGPAGLQDMTDHILAAWKKDIDIRLHGLEHGEPAGYQVHVHEIKPGVIYQDANVKVTAFLVKHGSWDQAFGYRFDTADRSVVISGDTAPTPAIVEACHGCDVLIHEVYPKAGLDKLTADDHAYFSQFHTSGPELAEIASQAKPRLLILYHQVFMKTPDDVLVNEVCAGWKGRVVSAKDLEVY